MTAILRPPAADLVVQSELTAEATARSNADTALADSVTAEATARAAAVAAEQSAREAGDTANATAIADEATARGLADAALDTRVDATETHLTRTDNPHATTKAQVGLANVDNTSDMDKPVSVFQQDALDLKADIAALELLEDQLAAIPTGPIWLPASQFDFRLPATSAIPTLETVGDRTLMKMPETTAWMGLQRRLPGDWTTYNVDLYWTRTGAEASGDVRLQWARAGLAEGGNVATTVQSALTAVTVTVPAQNILKVTRLHTNMSFVQGEIVAGSVIRQGFSGLDTFTGAIHVVGVLLTKAT